MSHRTKIIKEWIDLNITAANQSFKDSIAVDKHVVKIIGIAFSTNLDNQPYYRGSQRISINEREIYPEGYETKMIMQGINVPANERIIRFGEGEELDPGNRKVEFDYRDSDHPSVAFQAYKVRLYIYSRIDE